MRSIQTFVLRLLIDTDAPGALRGALRSIASGKDYPFRNEQTFLALLRRLCSGEKAEGLSEKPSAKENPPL